MIENNKELETETGDFAKATVLLRALIEARQFRKEKLEEEAVSSALKTVAGVLGDPSAGEQRLDAASLLGKAGEISKPILSAVRPMLEDGLRTPMPPIGAWGTADDRYYLAKGLSVSQAPWVKQYAAEELARAEVVEKASRTVWAEIAIARASDLAEILNLTAQALSQQLGRMDSAEETAYRKLIRIAESLSQSLVTADVPTGQEFGKAFLDLVRLAGGSKGAEMQKLREEAALKILDLLIQALRLRFDALFDHDLYRAVGSVRGWWRPANPPEGVQEKAERIAKLAFRGLHILARQGVADRELRRSLSNALGSSLVNACGREIAVADPSLDQRLAHWLGTGQDLSETQSNDAVRELNEQAADELLARLLLAIENQSAQSQAVKSVADALEVFEPAQASVLRSVSANSELVAQWTNALASKRQLSAFGTRGELVQYDPAIHEAPGQMQRLSTVRINTPGVIRKPEGRPQLLVIKAAVEKA